MSDPMKALDVWPKFSAVLGLLSAAVCPNERNSGHNHAWQCQWCDERTEAMKDYQSSPQGEKQ